MHTYTHAHTRKCTHTYIHACTHTHTQMHTHMHMHAHIHAQTHKHTHSFMSVLLPNIDWTEAHYGAFGGILKRLLILFKKLREGPNVRPCILEPGDKKTMARL